MEKILAAMMIDENSALAGIHALNLAKRINAHLSFLLIEHPSGEDEDEIVRMNEKIISLLQNGRSENLNVDMFCSRGDYADELIKFALEEKVTMVIIAPPSIIKCSKIVFDEFIEKLHHRLNCRMDIVHKRED